MRLFVMMSHDLTPAQVEDAKKSLGVEQIVSMPEELRQAFSSVPAELEDLSEYARPFVRFLEQEARPKDFVLVQGEFGLVYKLVEAARVFGLVPLYATTRRIVKEEFRDGKVIKVSEFQHIRYRRYG